MPGMSWRKMRPALVERADVSAPVRFNELTCPFVAGWRRPRGGDDPGGMGSAPLVATPIRHVPRSVCTLEVCGAVRRGFDLCSASSSGAVARPAGPAATRATSVHGPFRGGCRNWCDALPRRTDLRGLSSRVRHTRPRGSDESGQDQHRPAGTEEAGGEAQIAREGKG